MKAKTTYLKQMNKMKQKWSYRIFYAFILTISILLGGNTSIASAEVWDDLLDTLYYADMSELYVDSYDDYSLTISWYSKGTNTGFDVYRKAEFQSDYEWLGSVENEQYSVLEFTDDGFRRGFTYSYQVVAYEETQEDEKITVDTKTDAWKLDISRVTVTSVKRVQKVKAKLTWEKASGVDGYEIYKKTAGKSFKCVKKIKNEDTLKCTLKNISQKKNTYYKIRAYVYEGGKYAYGTFSETQKLTKSIVSRLSAKFLKLQKKYPDGKYWNHVGKKKFDSTTITSRPCHHNAYDHLADTCNYYYCPDGILGYQCYGFAWKMSDLIYGKKAKIKNFYSFSKCKAGDVIRYSGHSVIIVSKHSSYVTVGECNYGDTCIIKWGRKVYKAELKGAKYSRRYN